MALIDAIRKRITDKDANWPPKSVASHWDDIETYRRRYRNNRRELIQHDPNISIDNHKVEIYVPVPWPRELCRFSAALLFAETPKVTRIASANIVEQLMRVNDFGSFAIRGGIKAAAEGRIGIRVIRDPDVDANVPLLTLVPEDQILWDIRHGAFYAGGIVVITRKPNAKDESEVWRLLEQHTTGVVRRWLYKGDEKDLGKEQPLTALEEFAKLLPEEQTGLSRPTLIPWENVPGGESDLFGLGGIFDVLNESESLLLDRARKAIPRVFVDRSLVDETGRAQIDGYIISGGSRLRPAIGDKPGELIHTVQPTFDAPEHLQWVDHLQQLMVTCAGYAPTTWGIQGQTATIQRAVSGYAMKLAQLRTLLTRSQKEHMALEALGWAVATAITMMTGGGEVADNLPTIELGDGLPNDPLDGAQEVLYLRQAMAASTETLVRTVHSTWTDAEVDAEVSAILASGTMLAGGNGGMGGAPLGGKVKKLLDDADEYVAGGGVDNPTAIGG